MILGEGRTQNVDNKNLAVGLFQSIAKISQRITTRGIFAVGPTHDGLFGVMALLDFCECQIDGVVKGCRAPGTQEYQTILNAGSIRSEFGREDRSIRKRASL